MAADRFEESPRITEHVASGILPTDAEPDAVASAIARVRRPGVVEGVHTLTPKQIKDGIHQLTSSQIPALTGRTRTKVEQQLAKK